MGPEGVKACLRAGANDLGGTDERDLHPRRWRRAWPGDAARGDGGADPLHRPHAAATHHALGEAPETRTLASLGAALLLESVNTPARRCERQGRWSICERGSGRGLISRSHPRQRCRGLTRAAGKSSPRRILLSMDATREDIPHHRAQSHGGSRENSPLLV
jgi:hypothetical protein